MGDLIDLYVREYIQVAHRLTVLKGKCQQIHGHSMLVTVTLQGLVQDGISLDPNDPDPSNPLDFSEIKASFRHYLNERYDHHLLLNSKDPWAVSLTGEANPANQRYRYLPGLIATDGDPTVENIARWIFQHMHDDLQYPVKKVEVQETATNGVIASV